MAVLVAALLLALGDSPAQILQNVDAARNAFPEAIITARAVEMDGDKVLGSADFDIYAKGEDRGLIVFRGGKNSGRRILDVGDRMWLLVPGATHPVPITPNQRLSGGASVGDVARVRFAQDYDAAARKDMEEVGGKRCRVLDLTARSPKAAYPKVVLWYDEAAELPARLEFSLPSGLPAKEITFTRFVKSFGKTVVAEMDVRDLLARGSNVVTRVEYRQYRPARLDDKIFTPEGAAGV
ncbi:MAG TPA: outer membrane lipoprotein-sorting protein [Thermoanaerobaculia bacterium]|nr:outer membrane lipoprotein-sorting protein [Thermoanaerobaculia bacterium]